LPADVAQVCEPNATGTAAGYNCSVAASVAAAIPVDASGEFALNFFVAPRNANEDFTCTTQTTYYQCVLNVTGATYYVAFGREGR
jgi:hypothetical protein